MPTKRKGAVTKAQEQKARELRRNKDAQYRESLRAYKQYKKAVEKAKKADARARDKELRNIIKRAAETGIYSPKSTELTKYRRAKARQIKEQYGEYIKPEKFFFIPAGKEARKKILERASSLEMKTSRTGIFFPKEGHKSAKLKQDKRRGEYYIERRGKTKTGINRGRIYKDVTPLASVDELDRERDRLRKMAKRLGPFGPNDRLAFRISENGVEGYSHNIFGNIDLLIRYLDSYPKSVSARINFFRHIRLEKTTTKEWITTHPTRSPGRRGRQKIARRPHKG